jgi:uncharacterized tellurite resistance protein B-like protein
MDSLSLRRAREGLALLQRNDPRFEEASFYRRVEAAFHKIQTAWSEQRLELVRPFVSDGIFERFSLQLREQQDQGWRNKVDSVKVKSVRLVEMNSDIHFEIATLRIQASAIDQKVSLQDGNPLGRRKSAPQEFIEFWSFIRRKGTQTRPNQPGLMEGNCPNCGTPVEFNQTVNCSSCQASLRSGRYDWVLAEITQACEWRSRSAATTPGLALYIERHDPGFHTQLIEDRASVMFWRKAMADRQGSIAPLKKIAAEEFCGEYEKNLKPLLDQERYYFGDCAVGSVETLGVLPGGDFDQVVVAVQWSGRRLSASTKGRVVRTEQSVVYQHAYVLGRKAGVRTDLDLGVSSSHCPGCGGPATDEASHACLYCGVTLNDGSRGWVLFEILPRYSPEVDAFLRKISIIGAGEDPRPRNVPVVETSRLEPSLSGLKEITWMAAMMAIDGHVDAKERNMLLRAAQKKGVPTEQAEKILEAAVQGRVDISKPTGAEDSRVWMIALTDAALADGRMDKNEEHLLVKTGKTLGMAPFDVDLLINKRRAFMYQQARLELRQARKSGGSLDTPANGN